MDHGPRDHDSCRDIGRCRRTVQSIETPLSVPPARSIPSSSRFSLSVHNPETDVRSVDLEPDILCFAVVRHLFQRIMGTGATGYG